MIYIYFTKFDKPIETKCWFNYLKLLPPDLYLKSKKYVRWQDKHAFVLGKLLLLQCLVKVGYSKKKICELQYNEYGKPRLSDDIDFNIAHSGKYVICAIGKKLKLGIDIETISDIEFDDFSEVMTPKQWRFIRSSKKPIESFYRFWTIKESVIKAEEKGLSIPLLDIRVNHNEAHYKERIWYLKELTINKNICTCLATNIRNPKLNFVEIDFYSGINECEVTKSIKLRKRIA